MTIEHLKENVTKLKNANNAIHEKREHWKTFAKPLLKETLNEIKKAYDLDWNVYIIEHVTNSEAVNITFGNSSSGIYERTATSSKVYTKKGGALTFSQAYNGEIFVILIYPSIEELVMPKDQHKVLLRVDPSKIDKAFILQQVDNFLKVMIDWESNDSSSSLGFKI